MSIKIGDRLPDGKLREYKEVEAAGCNIGCSYVRLEGVNPATDASNTPCDTQRNGGLITI